MTKFPITKPPVGTTAIPRGMDGAGVRRIIEHASDANQLLGVKMIGGSTSHSLAASMWSALGGQPAALDSLQFVGSDGGLPSIYAVTDAELLNLLEYDAGYRLVVSDRSATYSRALG
jgi:hypothetical protein